MLKAKISLSAMLLGVLACSESVLVPTATITPLAATLTPTQTAIAAAILTPTWTLTPTATVTPTRDWWATPTMITPGGIIEVTPLGDGYRWATPIPKLETLSGTYTPYGASGDTQNVRYGPGIGYAIRYRLAAGKPVRVYAWVSDLPSEAWLCLDAPQSSADVACNESLALVYGRQELGELIYD